MRGHPTLKRTLWLLLLVPLTLVLPGGTHSNAAPVPPPNDWVWVEDSLPANAKPVAESDVWSWVNSSPTPFSGSLAHKSLANAGLHQHYFYEATATMSVSSGEVLVAYVYIDPANLPSELILQWREPTGSWDHRAYWKDTKGSSFPWGAEDTASRRYMGPLPRAGQWVRLEVPADMVGAETRVFDGMAFTLIGGQATWDHAGKYTPSAPPADTSWVEDQVPNGAVAGADPEPWSWVTNPRFSGTLAHQSQLNPGIHQHYFYNASTTLTINSGDVLVAYIYIDPTNLPSQVMLQWYENFSWEHRAYWGSSNFGTNQIPWGTEGTANRRYMGVLPPAGRWARLEVPASLVALEGRTVSGMAFTLYGGRATWDHAGKVGVTMPALYEGYLDDVNCSHIVGWTWNRNSPGTRLNVSVFDDSRGGILIATGTADQYRQDLQQAGYGDGNYGFWIPTPASLKDGLIHSIRVRVTGTTFNLGNTPKSFSSTCATPTPTPTPTGPIRMTVLTRTPASKHANFRVQVTGFSVSRLPDRYNVYGTSGYDLWKWNSNNTNWDSLYSPSYPYGANREDCSHVTDPRLWHPKCSSDAIGYFWKRISCPTAGVACEDNDRWNASPGTYNLTTFASPTVWPNPNTAPDFGTPGYSNIIDAGIINKVSIQPAASGCKQFGDTVWLDDTLPRGASLFADGGDVWNWVYPNPAPTPYEVPSPVPSPSPVGMANPTFTPPPYPSWLSHQSKNIAGMHQHYFVTANQAARLKVNAGDKLFAYVNLNASSTPQQVMLQWHEVGGLWYRASWGANRLSWPAYQAGGLPPVGVWYRLEVDASQVGLVGKTLDGMAFTLFDGQATWDRAGKSTAVTAGICPPKISRPPEQSLHAYNPDEFATGAANAKAVRVKYATGQVRCFMVFNKQIKFVTPTYGIPGPYNFSMFGGSAADNWQMMWATSADGANWTVHPNMLLRSPAENAGSFLGVLVTDMMIDEGYFYILFQDLMRPNQYLIRAPIDTVFSTSSPGYLPGEWRIASHPIQANGEYTWKTFTLGTQVDFDQLGAYRVMPTHVGWEQGGFVKQGALARIFSSTSPTTSLYFAVTNDAFGPLQLWKTTSLSKPFQYESDITFEDPNFVPGAFGWEFGFSHYVNNTAATPQILSGGFDFWLTENLQSSSPTGVSIDGLVTLSRHTAKLTGF